MKSIFADKCFMLFNYDLNPAFCKYKTNFKLCPKPPIASNRCYMMPFFSVPFGGCYYSVCGSYISNCGSHISFCGLNNSKCG